TPMRTKPRSIDASPSSIIIWLAYQETGGCRPLEEHFLITSRGRLEGGGAKRSHYALVCNSKKALLSQTGDVAPVDHRAVRNLVSSNPVGSSQVTAVVRYEERNAEDPVYPVLFRATLCSTGFLRLAMPVEITRDLWSLYR